MFFIVIVAGRVLGPGVGFVVRRTRAAHDGALLTGGVGPWLPFQMICAGAIGLGAGLLPGATREPASERWVLAAYALTTRTHLRALHEPLVLAVPRRQRARRAWASSPAHPSRRTSPTTPSSTSRRPSPGTCRAGCSTPSSSLLAGPALLRVFRRGARRAAFGSPVVFEPDRRGTASPDAGRRCRTPATAPDVSTRPGAAGPHHHAGHRTGPQRQEPPRRAPRRGARGRPLRRDRAAAPTLTDPEWSRARASPPERRPATWRTLETADVARVPPTPPRARSSSTASARGSPRSSTSPGGTTSIAPPTHVRREADRLVESLCAARLPVVVVTNEVGWSLVRRRRPRAASSRTSWAGSTPLVAAVAAQRPPRRRRTRRRPQRGSRRAPRAPGRGRSMRDAWRLTFGTFTAFPRRPPAHVDRRRARPRHAPRAGDRRRPPSSAGSPSAPRRPRAGLPRPSWPCWRSSSRRCSRGPCTSTGSPTSPTGSPPGHDPARSLEVMRRGDTGPAGAAALVLVLLLDAACLTVLLGGALGHGAGRRGPRGQPARVRGVRAGRHTSRAFRGTRSGRRRHRGRARLLRPRRRGQPCSPAVAVAGLAAAVAGVSWWAAGFGAVAVVLVSGGRGRRDATPRGASSGRRHRRRHRCRDRGRPRRRTRHRLSRRHRPPPPLTVERPATLVGPPSTRRKATSAPHPTRRKATSGRIRTSKGH